MHIYKNSVVMKMIYFVRVGLSYVGPIWDQNLTNVVDGDYSSGIHTVRMFGMSRGLTTIEYSTFATPNVFSQFGPAVTDWYVPCELDLTDWSPITSLIVVYNPQLKFIVGVYFVTAENP